MQFRAMILGIVADGHHAAAGDRAGRSERLEEFPEALTIESSALATKQELAVSQAHSSEVSDALACGVMVNHRISGLWRGPHTAPRSLLLKVHFVQSPKIDEIVRHQFSEFFFMLLLPCCISLGQKWPGLAQAKVQLTEQSLALAHSPLNPIGLLDPCRQSLAIP